MPFGQEHCSEEQDLVPQEAVPRAVMAMSSAVCYVVLACCLIWLPHVSYAAGDDTFTSLPEQQWFNPSMHTHAISRYVASWSGQFTKTRCQNFQGASIRHVYHTYVYMYIIWWFTCIRCVMMCLTALDVEAVNALMPLIFSDILNQ